MTDKPLEKLRIAMPALNCGKNAKAVAEMFRQWVLKDKPDVQVTIIVEDSQKLKDRTAQLAAMSELVKEHYENLKYWNDAAVKAERKLAEARDMLRVVSERLNSFYMDKNIVLEASCYSIDDDEAYNFIGYPRDEIDAFLNRTQVAEKVTDGGKMSESNDDS